jgi:Rhamnan synthesis protein F
VNRDGERWVVYAAFDAEGRAAPHAVAQLAEYRDLGFETLVVDTSPSLSAERAQDWRLSATDWLQRPNIGYDFLSYRTGVETLVERRGVDLGRLSLILANDSCFGPFIPLRGVLERLDALPPGRRRLCGITENHEIRRHLQSYWLYMRPDVTPLVVEFLRAMPVPNDRAEAIAFGELALSDHLLAQGCELHAYLAARDVLERFARFRGYLPSLAELGWRRLVKRPKYSRRADTACLKHLLGRADALLVNPTLDFGVHLLREGCSPFVKKELLRDNPHRDPQVPDGLDVATLRNADVERLLGSRAPRFDP